MEPELKQRLMGASLIIALAVIFVPMLFDGDGDGGQQSISIEVPEEPQNLEVKNFEIDRPINSQSQQVVPPEEAELQQTVIESSSTAKLKPELKAVAELTNTEDSQPLPQVEVAENTPSKAEPLKHQEQQKQQKTADRSSDVKESQQSTPKPALKEDQKPATKPTSVLTKPKPQTRSLNAAYRIKLGSFSKQANAQKVKNTLLQKNIKTIVEHDRQRQLYHVWSKQLYQDKASANQYVTAVKATGLKIGTPKVLSLDTKQVAQTVSQTQLGQVVQLGVFSSSKNAIELRNKVLAAGFKQAFVDQVKNSAGKSIYRLRVGPFAEPKDALSMQQKIKKRLKIAGLIKQHQQAKLVR